VITIPSRTQWAELERDVKAVQRGRLLVSDRVADEIDRLWDDISEFPWQPATNPSDWDQALDLAPTEARAWLDTVVELQALVAKVRAHYGTDGGLPDDIGVPVLFDPNEE
jgi:hypothetical protein